MAEKEKQLSFTDLATALKSRQFSVDMRGVYFDYEEIPDLYLCEVDAAGKVIREEKISE